MKRFTALVTGMTLGLAAGCAVEPDVVVGAGMETEWRTVVDVPWRIKHDLDLLFVVDNTDGMEAKQRELEVSFNRLLAHLEFAKGGLPNLHIGVVSTDMGVGSTYAVDGCTQLGDRGHLQCRDPELCGALSEPFLRVQAMGRDFLTNYASPLPPEQAVGRLARLGTSGCPFEQPLASMRTALYSDAGSTFRRPGAALGVVFLSNEDDCSAASDELFNPQLDGVLGDGASSPSKFRCFEHGVQCKGDDVYMPGMREGCAPREDSPYVASVAQEADFLMAREDPEDVVVSGIIGGADIVEIKQSFDDGLEVVSYGCERGVEPYPAVRLKSFVQAFDNQGAVSPLCGENAFDALTQTARRLRKTLGTDCLEGMVADMDPAAPGRQPECRIRLEHADGSADAIPECPVKPFERELSPITPCYVIDTGGAACGDFETQLRVDVIWGKDDDGRARSQPVGSHVIGECLIEVPEAEAQAE